MIDKLKSGIRKPKARTFLLFLACAIAAWLVSRLSETYTYPVVFKVAYGQAPDSLILVESPPQDLEVRVRASGFKLLAYQLSPRRLEIDLAAASRRRGRYFIQPRVFRDQIDRQMDNGIAILDLPQDTVFLNFQRLQSRTVSVEPVLELELAQNYMMQGEVKVDPPQVHLLGPPEEIDTIRVLRTQPVVLKDVRDSIRLEVPLEVAGNLQHTRLSREAVVVSANIFRFSETVVDVPIEVINIPERLDIRTFPTTVGILCRGKVDALNTIQPEDFRVVADFGSPDPETGRLPLILERQPGGVYNSSLLEASVEFIIRRE